MVDFFFEECDFLEEDFFEEDFVDLAAAGAAAGASADVWAATFETSAAIEPAARPKANKAEVIRVPDLFILSPAVVLTCAQQTPQRIPAIRTNQPR